MSGKRGEFDASCAAASRSLRARKSVSDATKPLGLFVRGLVSHSRDLKTTYPIECATNITLTVRSSGGHGFSQCALRRSITLSFSLGVLSITISTENRRPSSEELTMRERKSSIASARLSSRIWGTRQTRHCHRAIVSRLGP